MTHSKTVCRECKRTITQCRCMDASKTVIEVVCIDCQAKRDGQNQKKVLDVISTLVRAFDKEKE